MASFRQSSTGLHNLVDEKELMGYIP